MQTLYPHSAGLDVHKRTVVAAYLTGHDDNGNDVFERQPFATMTRDLLALADRLHERGLTPGALESTGEYWKPVYPILEDPFPLRGVNAHHVKHVPGRKTDMKDAEWLCKLRTHGLLSSAFIPPQGQHERRELTRARQAMVRERTNRVNRLIARFDREIEKQCLPVETAVAHLDTLAGVGKATAQQSVAEVGTDLRPFPTAGPLCGWAGVAPDNHHSGGKPLSIRTRQGNRSLKRALVEAAWAAARGKATSLCALYHRLAGGARNARW